MQSKLHQCVTRNLDDWELVTCDLEVVAQIVKSFDNHTRFRAIEYLQEPALQWKTCALCTV